MTSGQPRVRGEHVAGGHGLRQDHRVSPACAGNTQPVLSAAKLCAGQPRVRGGHACNSRSLRSLIGSAPRARGTRGRGPRAQGHHRVSPACAGNTSAAALSSEFSPGSAPRARGTLVAAPRVRGLRRVSPACAGNTVVPQTVGHALLGQSRVRGEHSTPTIVLVVVVGSAPRARGTLTRDQSSVAALRVSPACAGNTNASPSRICGTTGQPRVRGEHP